MKKFGKIIENLIVVLAGLIVIFLLATMFLPKFGYTLVIIRSGSMEPTIHTGGVVISKRVAEYQKGDIITFRELGKKDLVTHRIAEKDGDGQVDGSTYYKTKGDANNVIDQGTIGKNSIIGKAVLILPVLGYLIAFVQNKIVMLALILIPAVWFIIRQGITIKKEVQKNKGKNKNDDIY